MQVVKKNKYLFSKSNGSFKNAEIVVISNGDGIRNNEVNQNARRNIVGFFFSASYIEKGAILLKNRKSSEFRAFGHAATSRRADG